jgi:hypothetical protein
MGRHRGEAKALGAMYPLHVNYFDRYGKAPDEHPTVGMILCQQKRSALVDLTLPIFATACGKKRELEGKQ